MTSSIPLLGSAVSWGMLALGMALMAVILLKRSGRYYRRLKRDAHRSARPQKPTARRTTSSGPSDTVPLIDAPPEILRWQVEMHETARALKAELDSKMSVLQTLTQMAGEQSARLEAAIRRAEQLGLPRTQDPLDVLERLQELSDGELPVSLLSDPAPAADLLAQQIRSAIYTLADQGHAPDTIATRTGRPIGEVEMLLSLRG